MSLTHGGFFEICVIRVDNCEIGSFKGKSTRITKKIEKCLSRHKKIIKTKHHVTNHVLVNYVISIENIKIQFWKLEI